MTAKLSTREIKFERIKRLYLGLYDLAITFHNSYIKYVNFYTLLSKAHSQMEKICGSRIGKTVPRSNKTNKTETVTRPEQLGKINISIQSWLSSHV